ncbi:DUF1489 family protein [Mesorhizobium muleiense]|uniref:DUF1489 family protein n=1 Tax=Mesorhizobium muleiense TaxID=1004279 RepID=A0A1G8TPU6_9HYPH|nr:DUF1489 family protein [Mesorhizobium muleiense]MCF6101474.1 DUF1489 family protein [Mesorhizobium muleiense]SDJ43434.1 hypothetical protein SAMN05428953_106141 [Mesorhizobium muleiense]
MSLNLIKLCVGCDSVEDLEEWIAFRLDERRRAGEPVEHYHTTRMTPTRGAEVTDGGSLYWVIKGNVQCRQLITEIRPFTDDEGIGRCHLILDPAVVPTEWQPRRAFQGWRYLKPSDAPADLSKGKAGLVEIPPKLRRELADLGLL